MPLSLSTGSSFYSDGNQRLIQRKRNSAAQRACGSQTKSVSSLQNQASISSSSPYDRLQIICVPALLC